MKLTLRLEERHGVKLDKIRAHQFPDSSHSNSKWSSIGGIARRLLAKAIDDEHAKLPATIVAGKKAGNAGTVIQEAGKRRRRHASKPTSTSRTKRKVGGR